MKIAIVGCGALGSYYGARLARSGHDVWFLLRSDYESVKQHGVEIITTSETFTIHPNCAQAPEEIGICDLVIIGLKTTANYQFQKLLPPLVGPSTVLLTLQNGLGNEEQLAALFGPQQVIGGLCFVCLNRVAPGKILHIAHGKIVMGEFEGTSKPRTHAIADAIRKSGVPCHVTENIRQAHWEKLVWNIPFNGLGVAGVAGYESVISGKMKAGQTLIPCPTTEVLLQDERWERLVRELMMEVIYTANALGLEIPERTAADQISRTREMGAYKASTLIDFERGQPLELGSLFLEPLRQARKSKVATPRLESLCQILQQLDSQRK